jgi:general secretion pathway protein G
MCSDLTKALAGRKPVCNAPAPSNLEPLLRVRQALRMLRRKLNPENWPTQTCMLESAMAINTRRTGTQRGFTLLELLVVLVIIGLLAGIVGPKLFSNVDKSKITTARAQINVLGKAVDQLRLDIDRYPSSQEGLNLLLSPPADGTQGWNGPYLSKSVPLDPWGMPYHYASPGTHNADYDIVSYGSTRAPGGTGANAEIHN